MLKSVEAGTAVIKAAKLSGPSDEPGKLSPNLLLGAQRLLLEEIRFVRAEMLDRMQTETHLFGEFLSKMAQAHSVNDILMMYEICGQHQMDFIQRDWARLFKHARHLIDLGHGEVETPNAEKQTATIRVAQSSVR
jgi:hypothetical protein